MKIMLKWSVIFSVANTSMPAMIRQKGLGRKIAYAILGVPSNIKNKKTARQKEIDRRLLYDNTQRVR